MILEARDLVLRYRGRDIVELDALDLPSGSVTAIVGPNGSGKSSLLRMLAFVERPARGTLRFDGRPIQTERERRAARLHVTLVEQYPLLFAGTVRQNLRYGLKLRDLDDDAAGARITESTERMGAAHLLDRRARGLSGGETQRVALARALALRPRVLLLDEPLSGADRSAMLLLGRAITDLQAGGTSVCFTSHQLEEAYRWAERVVALTEGRVTGVTPENLFRTDLPSGKGPKLVRAGPLELLVVTDRVGPATVLVSPDDLLVSVRPLQSSARNHFDGKIIRIAEDGRGGVALTVDVGTDLVARITRDALDDLGLALGTAVVLSVKAMAVRVF